MRIHEMTEEECRAALELVTFGRLACAREDQPYVVPISFSYDRKHVYGFSTPGQKIEWMRSNPLVCLEIDERTSHYQSTSVIVYGRYEELPDAPEFRSERAHAHEVLKKRAMWWQPAYVATEHPKQLTPIFYRIHVHKITGHRAAPDPTEDAALGAKKQPAEKRWLGNILGRRKRATVFVMFEPEQTTTHAAIRLRRTDHTDALLSNSDLDFGYDRLRSQYRLRLSKDDIERCSTLLCDLMKKAEGVDAA